MAHVICWWDILDEQWEGWWIVDDEEGEEGESVFILQYLMKR